MSFFSETIKTIIPAERRRWLRQKQQGFRVRPFVGWVRFGSLRRVTPISPGYGYDRGLPVDRYYIERFLADHAADIRGRVLEIADNSYTRRFGDDRVTRSDVLHIEKGHPGVTIVGDLTHAEEIPTDAFDCIVLTQTLLVIYDVRTAIQTLHRILKPGGVLLTTFPGVSHKISRYDMDRWGDFWRFTTLSARRLFEEAFPAANIRIEAYGNVLTAIAMLHGLATEELSREELDYFDPDFEVSIAVRVVKPEP